MAETVLLVDDEKVALEFYRTLIGEHHNVEIATSGEEALEMLRDGRHFAVVVADYRMPGMNGLEVLVAAQRLAPKAGRILLTGQATVETAMAAVNEARVTGLFEKSDDPMDVVAAVDAAVSHYRRLVGLESQGTRKARLSEEEHAFFAERRTGSDAKPDT